MQNKTTLQTPNEILTVNEPWHRGSGFTWMLLALAGLVFFLSGAVAKAGDIWDGYVQINSTWYNVGGANNAQYSSNTGGAQSAVRQGLNSVNFGTGYYGSFGITGFSVLGWTHMGENVGGGGADYKLWKSGASETSYANYYNVNGGNYAFGNNNYNQNYTSQTTQLIGADWINGDTYNLKVKSYTTIAGSSKFYEATGTVTVGGARQLYNSSSDQTQSTYYNTSAAGGLVKQGTGTLTLALDNSNASSGQKGDIYIDAGTIAINPNSGVTGNQALGGSGAVVRLGAESGTAGAGFSLTDSDGGLEVGRQIVVRSGSSGTKTISSSNSSGVNTLSGTISLDANVTISGASGSGILDLTGKLEDGAGSGSYAATISTGTVRLSGNQSNTGITDYTVANGATLRLNKTSADAVQSTLTINSGGTAQLDGANQLGSGAVVNNSGNLNVGAHNDTLATLNSSGTIQGTGTLTATTYNISGGTVHANLGSGALNVTGDTTLHGSASANTIAISGNGTDFTVRDTINSGDVTIAAGARLLLTNTYNVSGISLVNTVNSVGEAGYNNGGEIDLGLNVLKITGANTGTKYQNSISGAGELRMEGSGTTALELYGTQSYTGMTRVSGGKIRATTALASSGFEVTGGTLETTADDVIGNSANVTISGGDVSLSGSDTIGALSASGGRLTVANGKTITLSGNSSVSGSADIVGGTLSVASGSTLTLNSDDVSNSSAISIASGATLNGSGTTTGALSVSGTLAPGNSTGILDVGNTTFLGGGNYDWEIDNFTGVVGTNWDFLDITGSLTISATSTPGSQFIIDVISLLAADDTTGLASNFNSASNYTFAIATASGGITGYDAAAFSINTSGFQNAFTGTWGTSVTGNSLNITYTAATAIPEPSSASMLVLGLAAVLAKRRRVARG